MIKIYFCYLDNVKQVFFDVFYLEKSFNFPQVSQRSLRQCIGVVPQDTVLFNETIKYNIAYGRVDSSDVEVKEAAASADIHNKIELFPEGNQSEQSINELYFWITWIIISMYQGFSRGAVSYTK